MVNGKEASHWSRFLICLISSLHRECLFRVMIICAGSRFRLKSISGRKKDETEDFNARIAPYCICRVRQRRELQEILCIKRPNILEVFI